jgi:hypothetical protein
MCCSIDARQLRMALRRVPRFVPRVHPVEVEPQAWVVERAGQRLNLRCSRK